MDDEQLDSNLTVYLSVLHIHRVCSTLKQTGTLAYVLVVEHKYSGSVNSSLLCTSLDLYALKSTQYDAGLMVLSVRV
jgi:hypothetical protein